MTQDGGEGVSARNFSDMIPNETHSQNELRRERYWYERWLMVVSATVRARYSRQVQNNSMDMLQKNVRPKRMFWDQILHNACRYWKCILRISFRALLSWVAGIIVSCIIKILAYWEEVRAKESKISSLGTVPFLKFCEECRRRDQPRRQ